MESERVISEIKTEMDENGAVEPEILKNSGDEATAEKLVETNKETADKDSPILEAKSDGAPEVEVQEGASNNQQVADTLDPYAYLQRPEFSSENFKIEIMNLPKYYGAGVSSRTIHCLKVS